MFYSILSFVSSSICNSKSSSCPSSHLNSDRKGRPPPEANAFSAESLLGNLFESESLELFPPLNSGFKGESEKFDGALLGKAFKKLFCS